MILPSHLWFFFPPGVNLFVVCLFWRISMCFGCFFFLFSLSSSRVWRIQVKGETEVIVFSCSEWLSFSCVSSVPTGAISRLITLVTSKGNSYIECWFSLWCICVVLEFFKIIYILENNRGLFLESVEMQRKELTLSVVWNALELNFFPHLIYWTLLVILHEFCLALSVFFH